MSKQSVSTFRSLALGLGFAAVSAEAQAPVDLRLALVIGNAAYVGAPLLNPANDARAMGDTLRGLGFTVIEVRDADKTQMQAAVSQAGAALKGRNAVGMLYYAGHGLQLDWHNYMLPVDAKLAAATDVPVQALDMQQVIDMFRAANTRINIVVLDACRDNPFGATASGKGLAPMDAPPGTLLAYATAPGNVAEDGSADVANGLYTQYLVRELKVPNAKIEDVFKRVRFEVRRQSQGRQVPWESTSLEDDFYFDARTHVVKLDDGERSRLAVQALERERTDWNLIKTSTQLDDFYAFLRKYPNGLVAEQAQFRLDQLQRTQVVAQPGANGVVPLRSGRNRFAVGDEFGYEIIDGYTKAITRIKRSVTFADNERVELNGGENILDQMGGVVLNREGRKDPALVMAPAELSVGKRWRAAFTNTRLNGTKSDNYYDFRVVGLEDVTVPAGTFRAFKVERVGQARAPDGYTVLTGTAWIDPITMITLRNDTMNRTGGRLTEYQSLQLASMKLAPRPAGP